MVSLIRKERAAPTASPIYTRETKFLVESAPDSELMPKWSWKLARDEMEDADP